MAQKTPKKAKKRGPGRPKSNVQWEDTGIRFTVQDMKRVDAAAAAVDVSRAAFIRHGALKLVGQVETGAVQTIEP